MKPAFASVLIGALTLALIVACGGGGDTPPAPDSTSVPATTPAPAATPIPAPTATPIPPTSIPTPTPAPTTTPPPPAPWITTKEGVMIRQVEFELYIYCRNPTTAPGWKIAVEFIPYLSAWYNPSPTISGKVIGADGSHSVSGQWYAFDIVDGNMRYTPTGNLGDRILQRLASGGHKLELSLPTKRMRAWNNELRTTRGWDVVFNVAGLTEAIKGATPEGCPDTLVNPDDEVD